MQKHFLICWIVALGLSFLTVTVSAQGGPDIRIEMTLTPASAPVGSTITYSITITNSGASDLTNVRLNAPRLGLVDVAIYGGRVGRGEVGIIQGTYTIQESDAPGPLELVAIVSSDQTGSPSAIASVAITKAVPTAEIDPVYIGQTVKWQPVRACDRKCVTWQLYQTNQTGDWEIFRMDRAADSTVSVANISNDIGENRHDIAPSRSPDGEWITFASSRDGNWEIYISRVDGSDLQRVTENDQASDINPVWGPNNLIAYQSNREGNWKLFLFDTITGLETKLTDSAGDDINPAWSPSGVNLAFQTNRDNRWQIYELQPQTGLVNRLSNGDRNDYEPVYSPDGSSIAFRSILDGKKSSNIAIMGSRGGRIIPVTNFEGQASHPTWSADSQLLAYQSDVDGDQEIYLFDVNQLTTRQLTNNTISDYAPAFLCAGSTLLFNSDEAGQADIYQMDARTPDQPAVRLTTAVGDHLYPQEGSLPQLSDTAMQSYMPTLAAGRPAYPVITLERGMVEPPYPRMVIWNPVNACGATCPAWSVYTGKLRENWEILRYESETDQPIRLSKLTDTNVILTPDNLMPTVSPNGTWVVFTSNRDRYWELYMAGTDGVILPRRMTFTKELERHPVWSPSGQSILYESNRDGNWELYQTDISSGLEQRLTYNDTTDINGSWSPDGARIVFQSDRSGTSQIYLLNLQTGLVTKLSDGSSEDSQPVYAADNQHIAFRSVRPNSPNGLIVVKNIVDGSTTIISDPEQDSAFPAWSLQGALLAYQSRNGDQRTLYVYDAATQQQWQPVSPGLGAFAPAWACADDTLLFNTGLGDASNIYQLDPRLAQSSPITLADQLVPFTTRAGSKIFAPFVGVEAVEWAQLAG